MKRRLRRVSAAPKTALLKPRRELSGFQVALGVSLLIHAALLTIRFINPHAFDRIFQDTPLEVVLVNARVDDKAGAPRSVTRPQALAQHQISGGGEAARGLAASPLPSSPASREGDVSNDAQQHLQQLQAQQQQMLISLKQQLTQLPQENVKAANRHDQAQQEIKRQQLLNLLATIEKRIQQENARPTKRYIGPNTRSVVYAQYYDSLRRKIERIGTENFPTADGQKLYGELVVAITIDRRGNITELEIMQGGSGNRQLDQRAKAIARAAAPFGEFTEAMRRQADQLVVVTRFQFTKEKGLEAHVGG